MRFNAVIAGGGIGGLSAALHLALNGHAVTVIERVERLQPVGAGIVLSLNAIGNLRPLGILPALIDRSARIDEMVICTAQGRELSGSAPNAVLDGEPIQALGIHRAALHEVLLDRLQTLGVTLQLGAKFERFEESADGVSVTTVGPGAMPPLSCDLLVGADGLHSGVRHQIHGAETSRFGGSTCWRGVADAAKPVGSRLTEIWGKGCRFGIVPLADERVYWFAVQNCRAGYRPELPSEHLETLFADFPTPTVDLIRATPASAIVQHDLVDRVPLRHWGTRRVTLLGDAAHPMTPNMGQGAAQAIEDAGMLGVLTAPKNQLTAPDVVTAYEAHRIPRSTQFVTQSFRFGAMAQLENPVASGLRNVAMRATPNAVTQRALDRLLTEGVPAAFRRTGLASTAV